MFGALLWQKGVGHVNQLIKNGEIVNRSVLFIDD